MLRVCRLYAADAPQAAALYNAAMLKVFTNIHQYAGKGNLLAWIRRVVVHTCIDYYRSESRFVAKPTEALADDVAAIDPAVYAQLSAADAILLLQTLPKASAMVFNLFAIEGYKHHEIAALLGISVGTSKWHLNEARRLLQQRLLQIELPKTYSNAG
jgi:RNA polymerase sigma-70 factor, ECF subfamily